ncbi:MAG: hypothetical protein ACK4NX_02765, partial [Candidatus Paceibacteria bacterium]
GPTEVKSGETATYEVTFENNSRSTIKDASFSFRVDSGAVFQEAEDQTIIYRFVEGELPPGGQRKASVAITFWGKPDDVRKVSFSFRYLLGNFTTRFEATKDINVKITAPSLALGWQVPARVISGDVFNFKLYAENLTDATLKDAKVSVDFPEGFELQDANPKPIPNVAEWELGDLKAKEASEISFLGKMIGQEGKTGRFKARMDIPVRGERIILAQTEEGIAISENPLIISVILNNEKDYIASLAEPLEYRISFKNNFEISLRDVIVKATLESPLFDFSSIETSGAYSSLERTITWHGGNTPNLLSLSPQESGMVSFRVKTRDNFLQGMKNNELKVIAEINSPTKPPSFAGGQLVFAKVEHISKVQGKLLFDSKVLRNDPQATFQNAGPIPPRVNQATQYSAHFKVDAIGNDYKDVFIRTILPAGVTFTGRTSGHAGGTEFIYIPRTNEVFWQIP